MRCLGVPRELDDPRMAVPPAEVARVRQLGLECLVETGPGIFDDADYRAAGAEVVDRATLRRRADVFFQLRPESFQAPPGSTVIGFPGKVQQVDAFDLQLLPRITRAQSCDVLSTLATVAGYRAVLLAAERCPRFFPMLTTAAGTVPPAQVLVLGAGVAGLMAMATARRLGAVVTGYDIRPGAQEEIHSVGARVLAPPPMEPAEQAGGDPAEALRRQQEGLAQAVARSHVLICTASVRGRPAPLLVTRAMLEAMPPGAVVLDMAGGNAARADLALSVRELAAQLPLPCSQMLSRNLLAFLALLQTETAWQDELVSACCVARKETLDESRPEHPLPGAAPGEPDRPLGLASHLQP